MKKHIMFIILLTFCIIMPLKKVMASCQNGVGLDNCLICQYENVIGYYNDSGRYIDTNIRFNVIYRINIKNRSDSFIYYIVDPLVWGDDKYYIGPANNLYSRASDSIPISKRCRFDANLRGPIGCDFSYDFDSSIEQSGRSYFVQYYLGFEEDAIGATPGCPSRLDVMLDQTRVNGVDGYRFRNEPYFLFNYFPTGQTGPIKNLVSDNTNEVSENDDTGTEFYHNNDDYETSANDNEAKSQAALQYRIENNLLKEITYHNIYQDENAREITIACGKKVNITYSFNGNSRTAEVDEEFYLKNADGSYTKIDNVYDASARRNYRLNYDTFDRFVYLAFTNGRYYLTFNCCSIDGGTYNLTSDDFHYFEDLFGRCSSDNCSGNSYLFDPNVSSDVNCRSFLGDPDDPNHQSPAYYLTFVFKIMRYAAIILLIVLSMMDFLGAVSSQDNDEMKKATSKAIKRLIMCVVIFLLPSLLQFILKYINDRAVDLCIGN